MMQMSKNIAVPTIQEIAIVKKSGSTNDRRELKNEVTATDGKLNKIIIKSCLIILTSIFSFLLSIITFKIPVIVILIPIPKGRDKTPIYGVRHITEMKVKIPPII